MIVLGIESSCDETGLAVYDSGRGLLAHALHSQTGLHDVYGGVVPELASRDHIRRIGPLAREVLARAGLGFSDLDAVAYTAGPGLAGALLVGSSVACGLAMSLGIPAIGVHHLEGHLLSPMLAADKPPFPHVALLVSGGHTQLMRVGGVGDYTLLGETADDAAGEAFDKTAKFLGLSYPGGPALARLAESGRAGRLRLPRPKLNSDDLDFSFSGLKTAVVTACASLDLDDQTRADVALAFEEAVVEVLAVKSAKALDAAGLDDLVVAGGVGANRRLRAELARFANDRGFRVWFPPLELCTDNGAMIALAGALRLQRGTAMAARSFAIRPRWDLASV